jgi:hypothetical protein
MWLYCFDKCYQKIKTAVGSSGFKRQTIKSLPMI